MKKLTLKEVLKRQDIMEGIKSNLIREDYLVAIEETLNSKKENSISVIVDVDGFECDFENTLHVDEVKDCYFLESRLFNRKDGSMINSYLELLNTDGSIKEVYVDDIWDYANWEEVR